MDTASEAEGAPSETGAHNEGGVLGESTDAVNIDAAAAAAAAREEMESREPGSTLDMPGLDRLEEDEGVKVEKPRGLEDEEGVEVEKPGRGLGAGLENRLGRDW